MRIDRDVNQGGRNVARERIKFCLDQFESARDFNGEMDWNTYIIPQCTLEEIFGALVSAEQAINELTDEVES